MPVTAQEPKAISNEAFMAVVERIYEVGGSWSVRIDGAGITLTYENEQHHITMAQADAMWTHIPRKAQ